MSNQITRKQFLLGATSVVAASLGAVGASAMGADGDRSGQAGAISGAAAAWPFPYKKLNPDDVRKRGHKGYYDGGCCYGAFNALLQPHVEAVGEPFSNVPPQMMYYGGGGGAGWGTLCGALNGAAAFIAMVATGPARMR